MFGLKSSTYLFTGMSHEPKSSALSMISATQRNATTGNPLIPSSLNEPAVTNGSRAAHGTASTQGGHTASFAAALRKLAKQAEEPRGMISGSSRCHSPISSPVANYSSPAGTPKRAPGTIIVPTRAQRVANTPPVVTIAPIQSINGLWQGDGRQPSDSTLRSRSCDHPLSTESFFKKDKPPVPTHAASSHPAFCLSNHPIQESPYSTINLQRPVPHLLTSSSRSDDFLASFRPYQARDEIRTLTSLPSIGLNSPTSAAFYHPAFLSHLPYQHPPYRIDDPYCLSLCAPFFHIPQPGTVPPIQVTNMQLSLTGMRPPSGVAQPSLSGIRTGHLSVHTARRLKIDDDVREQEKEREQEKKDWNRRVLREREPEMYTEKGRKREKRQEMEWEKEIKRRKEMKQDKDLKIEYVAEKKAILNNDTAKRQVEEWKNVISGMEQPEKIKELSPGNGKIQTVPLEPIARPGSCSLLNSPSSASSNSSTLEGKYALHHNHQQQGMDEQPGHGVDFHQHHLQKLHNEQRHLFSEQERDKCRVFLVNENQHQLPHIGVPPSLISPHPLKEISPLLRPFNSAPVIQPTQALNCSTNYSIVNHYASKDPERFQNSNMRNDVSNKTTVELLNSELPKSCTDKVMNENKKSRMSSLRTGTVPHLKSQRSSHQSIKDLQQQISMKHLEELQNECLDLSTTSGAMDLSLKNNKSSPVPSKCLLYSNDATTSSVHKEDLPIQQPVVSKLDLGEKKLKEARMKGEISGYSSSNKIFYNGEIRDHIHRLAERPPLKLDDAPRKMLFLGAVGLTTQSKKDEVIQQKVKKRRRMLRECSPSPLRLVQKQSSPLPSQVHSIGHSPDELNKTSDFEEKKQFLALFNLKHLSIAQRKDYPGHPGEADVNHLSVIPPDSNPNACLQEELPSQPQAEQCRPQLTPKALEIVSKDHTSSMNGRKSDKLGASDSGSGSTDEAKPSGAANDKNGKWKLLDKPWQDFQEPISQSIKHQAPDHPKVVDQQSDRNCSSLVQSSSLCDKQAFQMLHQNRQVGRPSDKMVSEEEIDPRPKWRGVTDVLEAYQEYLEDKNLEQQILQEQLNHLKKRNHELSLTAEHLSVHMLELQLSKQRYEVERQYQQAALCHLHKCLDLTHCLPISSSRVIDTTWSFTSYFQKEPLQETPIAKKLSLQT